MRVVVENKKTAKPSNVLDASILSSKSQQIPSISFPKVPKTGNINLYWISYLGLDKTDFQWAIT